MESCIRRATFSDLAKIITPEVSLSRRYKAGNTRKMHMVYAFWCFVAVWHCSALPIFFRVTLLALWQWYTMECRYNAAKYNRVRSNRLLQNSLTFPWHLPDSILISLTKRNNKSVNDRFYRAFLKISDPWQKWWFQQNNIESIMRLFEKVLIW